MKILMKYSFLIYISLISANVVLSNSINPFINSVSPSMNAVSVNKSSNITIMFTQEMNAATVNGANIKVFGYQTGLLPVTIDYNTITKTANINPNQDLKAGENVSITLTSGIKTVSNTGITPFVFSFIVQATGGNGYFTKTSELDNYGFAYLKSGDIDRDGDIDILLNNRIFINNGDAVFTNLTSLDVYGKPELADFENDGDLDILIGRDSTVFFYRNAGSGSFIQTYNFPGRINSFGDMNGDGMLDITYYNSESDIRIVRNSNGVFSNDTNLHLTGNCLNIGLYTQYMDNLSIADLDNDGDLDMISISGWKGGPGFYTICRNFTQLMNNGNGSFFVHQFVTDEIVIYLALVFAYTDSRTFDFNNDGFIDIVSPNWYITNNHNSDFTYYFSNFLFCNNVVSDFNGDGKLDFVANVIRSSLMTNLSNGVGDFARFTGLTGRFDQFSTAADFDNDGDIDIAVKEYSSHHIAILLNGDVPLPAELISFTSEINNNTVNLNWSTSTEENNSGFDIERSNVKGQTADGWNKISFIQGYGTTSSPNYYECTDRNLNSGKYKYRLKQIDFNGNFKYYDLANEVVIGSPEKLVLSQNYPNPFNPVTHLGFGISNLGFVSLKLYDVLGNEITTLVNEIKPSGYYEIEFNGSGLPSGIYYYKLEAGSFSQVKKMMIVK